MTAKIVRKRHGEANNRQDDLTSGVNFDRSTSWGVCDGGVIVTVTSLDFRLQSCAIELEAPRIVTQ